MFKSFLTLAAPVLALVSATGASAQNNQGPPAGAVFSLAGLAQSTSYVNYSFSFVAQFAQTNLTFAMRNDPVFIKLDDISMTLGAGPNLITNGGFESGPVGGSAPTGWTYLNQYGAQAGGVVSTGCARTGSNCYYDGAVQAYDAITQVIATTIGSTYNVNFWASVSSIQGTGFYQALSTNGQSGTSGNGINLTVYAGQGAPPPAGGVPEPATWAMMMLGFGAMGVALRRQKVSARIKFA